MVTLRRCHTAELGLEELAAARALMDVSFGDFTDEDWDHALGGMHALAYDDGGLVAHGALVLRRLVQDGRSLRCGYVEAVATRPDARRRGHGDAVMEALEALAPAYDVLALSASGAGVPLYEHRGWARWRGPTYVLSPDGPVRTPGEEGSLFVLPAAFEPDLGGALACDWRGGDAW